MNKDVINGKWKEIKGDIRKMWGNVTGDELEKTKGDMTSISGLIQQRYGHEKDEVSNKLTSIFKKYDSKIEAKKEQMGWQNDATRLYQFVLF